MLIYGAGGHAKVVMSCIWANGLAVKGIFDDDLSKTSLLDELVIGKYDPKLFPSMPIIIAIGDNHRRRHVSMFIKHACTNVAHPTAVIEKNSETGPGTVILHGAIVQSGTRIGKHCIINTGAKVDHDCSLKDFVHIAPGAILCGNICIGENTLVGAGSIVVPNVSIGRNCLIAAGSVVTRSVPDHSVVRGNPGRIISSR